MSKGESQKSKACPHESGGQKPKVESMPSRRWGSIEIVFANREVRAVWQSPLLNIWYIRIGSFAPMPIATDLCPESLQFIKVS